MQWDALDGAGGDSAVETTNDHMIAFLCAYRLVDVLSLYDALVPSQPSIRIPRNPRLPILDGKKVFFFFVLVIAVPLIIGQ